MKLSELPVIWDLVKLPLPIFIKRLKKRLFADSKPSTSGEIPSELKFYELPEPVFPEFKFSEKHTTLLNHFLKDEFNYLGSGWVKIQNAVAPAGFLNYQYGENQRDDLAPDEVDWCRDQRSGFRFSLSDSPSSCLKQAFDTPGVDVKFSWEFARMHHLPQLALFYHKMPDQQQKILEAFRRHFNTFNKQTKSGMGIHWSSPMEVAIRQTNVLIAYHWLEDELNDIKDEVLDFAYRHFRYIAGHLEHKDGYGTNHYLSNLMGLIVSGYYLNHTEIRTAALWAWDEMQKEIQKQFFSDGFNFEYSTYYHRLSTEIVLMGMLYARKQSLKITTETTNIIAKAIVGLETLIKDDGHLPKFGDIDSGRILILNPEGQFERDDFFPDAEDSAFILKLRKSGSLYNWFYRDIVKMFSGLTSNPLLPKAAVNRTKRALPYNSEWTIKYPKVSTAEIKSHVWPKAGLVVFKSDEFYLAINLMTNPRGHRYRGHSHNDKGSFELQVNGVNYIEDPGVVSYTASIELRNKYRATRAHPIPFTGIEQNRYLSGFLGLFHSCLDARARIIKMGSLSLECEVFYRGVKVYRRFEIKGDRLIIQDWCNQPFTVNKNTDIAVSPGYGKLK